jgi:hypothetical protein
VRLRLKQRALTFERCNLRSGFNAGGMQFRELGVDLKRSQLVWIQHWCSPVFLGFIEHHNRHECRWTPRVGPGMAKTPAGCDAFGMAAKRKAPKRTSKSEYETQLSIRLDKATLDELDAVIETVGLGSRVEILRQAIAIGLPVIRKRYER